ncbi:MAG TPA: methyltransferase domain-containing protein [Chitinispirillaceae bacterium]|nr:methyltransferase domain-containing protein [Chitinispirillaceae bacterium]
MISYKFISEHEVTIHTSAHPNGLPYSAQFFKYRPDLFPLPLLRPSNPTDVLDQLSEDAYAKDKFLPYWAEQWPSSDVMLDFLKNYDLNPDSNIIELGSGLGIIATGLSLRECKVVATDISHEALIFTKTNVELNKLRSYPCCIDWRALPFKKRFDLLVASDILYEKRWIQPILSCCRELLKPGGKALIADPCRTFWPEFKQQSAKEGFSTTVVYTNTIQPQNITVEILEIQ